MIHKARVNTFTRAAGEHSLANCLPLPNRLTSAATVVFFWMFVLLATQLVAKPVVADTTFRAVQQYTANSPTLIVSRVNPRSNWADSYSHNGQCYCSSTFDHGAGTLRVQTPQGVKTVREICNRIGKGPGVGNNPVYNDVQCGNGPPNNAGDEHVCPGRVDQGPNGCSKIGPKWNLERYFSASNNQTASAVAVATSSDPVTNDSANEAEPVKEAEPVNAGAVDNKKDDEASEERTDLATTPSVTQNIEAQQEAPITLPVLESIPDLQVEVGNELLHRIVASDADGTVPSIYFETAPVEAELSDNGDGTRTLRWTPGPDDVGEHEVIVVAADAASPSLQVVTRFKVAVRFAAMEPVAEAQAEANQSLVLELTEEAPIPNAEPEPGRPVIRVAGAGIVAVGRPVQLLASVFDSDGLLPTLSAERLPVGAEWVSRSDGSFQLDWTPTNEQKGAHDMRLLAMDAGTGEQTSRYVRIVVVEDASENRAPFFDATDSQQLSVGLSFELVVRPVDPEGIAPALQVINAPSGASFDDNGDGSRMFRWTPGDGDIGQTEVTFVAIDHDDISLTATQRLILDIR